MLGIKQSQYHVKNESLYHLNDQKPLLERHLKFKDHCICMPTYDSANRFVIYEFKIRSSLRQGNKKDGGEQI